jgi:hypothetical protein
MANTLHFKIILIEAEPMIWRTFEVPDDYRMDRFHQVIQIVMGWRNCHLHEFRVGDRLIGMVDDMALDFTPQLEDEGKIYLRDLPLHEKQGYSYLYDFGDSWQHLLYLNMISGRAIKDPVCRDGRGACPLEDSGGVWGYANLLEILKNPDHPEHEEWIQWQPKGFDPNHFPIREINKELKKFGAWNRKHPRKRSTPWHQI